MSTATAAPKRQYVLNNSTTTTAAARPIVPTTTPTATPAPTAAAAATNSTHNTQYDTVDMTCPNCGSTDIIEDAHQGNHVCHDCGFVLSQLIDTGSEWRTFADDGQAKGVDNNRVGGFESALLADMGLSTVIGRTLDGQSNRLAYAHNNIVTDTKHRYLQLGFEKCQSIANALNLSRSIVDRSKETFKRSVDANAFKGKMLDSVITACIYISCKQERVQRTFKELCSTGHVSQRDVGRCFTKLREMKLHKRVAADGTLIHDVVDDVTQQQALDSMLERFCSLLTLPPTITRATQYICKRAIALDLVQGRQQASMAGAAIYLATQLTNDYRRDYASVAQVTYMSVTTIKQAYIALYNRRTDLIPNNFVAAERIAALRLNPNDQAAG